MFKKSIGVLGLCGALFAATAHAKFEGTSPSEFKEFIAANSGKMEETLLKLTGAAKNDNTPALQEAAQELLLIF